MKISEVIKMLQETQAREGDLPVFFYKDRDEYPGTYIPFQYLDVRKELAPGSDGQWSDAIVLE